MPLCCIGCPNERPRTNAGLCYFFEAPVLFPSWSQRLSGALPLFDSHRVVAASTLDAINEQTNRKNKQIKDFMRDSQLHALADVPCDASAMEPRQGTASGAAPDQSATPTTAECTLRRDDLVDLNVSGTRMTVLRSTLCAGPPTSILRRMFDLGDAETAAAWRPPMRDGAFFLDYDPRHFATIINALRYGADAARFGDGADVACVRGLASYLGLYDIEAECAYAISRMDDLFDPEAHASLSFVFEDSLGDGDHRLGVGCLPATVRVPRRWRASRALDAIADALGVRRIHLRFYNAYTGTSVLHDTHRLWSRDRLSIGAPIDPAPTSTVDQFPWAHHNSCALFVARAPVGPRIALCKIYDAAAARSPDEDTTGDVLPLRPGVRPFVFCLPPPGASACDVVGAACVRAGIDTSSVVAAYIEHQGGSVEFTRLAFPTPSVDDDQDDDDTAHHVPHGESLMLFVGPSRRVDVLISDLLGVVFNRWLAAASADSDDAG
nr:btb/poz domain [Pandoravirus massiliensis]